MLIRSLSIATMLFIVSGISMARTYAQTDDVEIDMERSGIVYSIGRVERIIGRAAVIDLGDAHTLKAEEQVAVFRATSNYFTPVGVVRIAETLPTSSQTYPSTTTIEAGDVVIFVREFSELQTPFQHRDNFIKRQIIKNSGSNGYSRRNIGDTATTLLTYNRNQPKWERRRVEILGYLNGVSFAEGGEKSIERLLNQINQFRKHYRSGQNSLAAAGPKWHLAMQPLMGKTAHLQHAASQVGNADEEPDDENRGPSIRDINRAVNDELFDRSVEERNLISYIVATALERTPQSTDQWVQQQAEQSQFARLPEEDVVLDVIGDLIRKLGDN